MRSERTSATKSTIGRSKKSKTVMAIAPRRVSPAFRQSCPRTLSDTTDPSTEITLTWMKSHNNGYDGSWSRWIINASTGKKAWKTTISRDNIIKTLETMTFTPTTTTAIDRKPEAVRRCIEKKLDQVPEVKYDGDFR